MLSSVHQVWARGGGIAGIPSAEDPELYTETPPKLEKTSELEPEEKTAYNRRRARIKRDNANMNSLRCDFKLKVRNALITLALSSTLPDPPYLYCRKDA